MGVLCHVVPRKVMFEFLKDTEVSPTLYKKIQTNPLFGKKIAHKGVIVFSASS